MCQCYYGSHYDNCYIEYKISSIVENKDQSAEINNIKTFHQNESVIDLWVKPFFRMLLTSDKTSFSHLDCQYNSRFSIR